MVESASGLKSVSQFFHSFPRSKISETQKETYARGLAILQTIKDVGLVLAPEIVSWDLTSIFQKEEKIAILQNRVCFTEIQIDSLSEHARMFGPFSLAFNIQKLRDIGAIPVIYVPQGSSSPISHLGAFSVYATHHTQGVLRQLEGIKNNSDPEYIGQQYGTPVSEDYLLHLRNTGSSGEVVAEYVVPAKHAQQVLAHVGFNNIPFHHSAAALGLFLHMFYPTDDTYHSQVLGYYRQREWRLVKTDIGFNSRPTSRPLTDQEREKLLQVDASFWSKEIPVEGANFPRHKLAVIYDPLPGWSIFDIVETIYAPSPLISAVQDIVGGSVTVSQYPT